MGVKKMPLPKRKPTGTKAKKKPNLSATYAAKSSSKGAKAPGVPRAKSAVKGGKPPMVSKSLGKKGRY